MDTIKSKIIAKRANSRQSKIKKALKSEKVIRASVKGAIKQQRELAGAK